MIIKITSEEFREIKKTSAMYIAADILTERPEDCGTFRPFIYQKLNAMTTRELYSFLKKNGFKFDKNKLTWGC